MPAPTTRTVAILFLTALLSAGTALAGPKGALGGASAAVGGILSAVTNAGGAVSSTVSGTLSGTIDSTAGSATAALPHIAGPAGDELTGPRATVESDFSPNQPDQLFITGSSNARAIHALDLMQRQQIAGKVVAVTSTSVTLQLANGNTRTLNASADILGALRSYIGKDVLLRSLDGERVSAIVGRDDIVRGIVTAIDGPIVTYVAPDGEYYVLTLTSKAMPRLQVGSRIVVSSHDFGKTLKLSVLDAAPASTLVDVYIGTLAQAGQGQLTLRFGSHVQTFEGDAALVRMAQTLHGKTVALNVPDGRHAKSFMALATLLRLAKAAHPAPWGAHDIVTTALKRTKKTITLQLPNGDEQTFVGNIAQIRVGAGGTLNVQALDTMHVRATLGNRAVILADANACGRADLARCRPSVRGSIIAVAAGSIALRLPSGDVLTFLGNTLPLQGLTGSPVTITPIDNVHVRVAVGATVVTLVRADACSAISAGCHAMVGVVSAASSGGITVKWPDASTTILAGAFTGIDLSAGTPIVLQPLDTVNVVVFISGKVTDATTVSALAPVATGAPPSQSSTPPPSGSAAPPSGGSSPRSPAAPPRSVGNSSGFYGSLPPYPQLVPTSNTVQLAYASGIPCSDDGQMIVSVVEGRSGRPLQSVSVRLYGPNSTQYLTGTDGKVIFMHLHAGGYTVQVSKRGYMSLTSSSFNVNCLAATHLNFALASTTATFTRHSTARISRSILQQLSRRAPVCVKSASRKKGGHLKTQFSCTKP